MTNLRKFSAWLKEQQRKNGFAVLVSSVVFIPTYLVAARFTSDQADAAFISFVVAIAIGVSFGSLASRFLARPPRSVFRAGGIIFGFVFCGAIVIFMGTPLLRGVYMTIASSSWPPVQAEVLAIESHPKSSEIRYEYVVSGTRYSGNTFAFLSSGSIPDKHVIEGSYRVGDRITVFVDPDNPRRSVVLRRPLHVEYIWVYVMVIVLTCLIGWRILRQEITALRRETSAPHENV